MAKKSEVDLHAVEIFARRARSLRPILKAIGIEAVRASQVAFRQQKFGGAGWVPRGKPSTLGIIADLNAGSTPKQRRFESRPALVDTGALRKSISFSVTGDTITVGTSLHYAPLLQEGGEVTKELTKTGQTKLGELIGQSPDKWAFLNKLMKKGSHKAKVRARPFVGMTPGLMKNIRRMLNEYFGGES